ncbi:DNA-3-methyladenine glycosylase [Megasphaera vaginalis (ex Srinivasan et al. 2021)]|uniref:Putative 3-methyladenine DNA glycosylase n=1 Tax=Megasphaera vaginalis (ex Srinivasan et al. 2021) TaxID=1111454 RepID=U7UHA6_9FIRM|nr:DNA-3-methyladenine glycosylase [Megasphaera vaginalis (ex Srinivasan et al. 2021)]ERT58671.1 DNA-3-methyladenine glycosylase [Megasphaera vaginalis (ex Srinivasan et al. 2021)]
MIQSRWQREEFAEGAVVLARALLGSYLVRHTAQAHFVGRIVETEAYGGTYDGKIDDGSHASRGRTKRTAPMFEAGGIAYVYLIYGMYHCFNIVTGPRDTAEAVLIRAVEPVDGISAMLTNRKAEKFSVNLTNGPGKLCRAMDITLAQNGVGLCGDGLYLLHDDGSESVDIAVSRRRNIEYAAAGKQFPWRFYLRDNPFVSK